ncbi:hypothetical protein VTO42DRAFT_5065 [Malbranchea cinnamomea]
MAFNKKYAGLPDLDLAPDIYETPELTDDSTLPTGTIRSSSPFQEESTPEIDRQRLRVDQARSHFEPARVDARDVDFSDSIASRRKSYKSLRGTRRTQQDGTEILGDLSDEEDETLERKLARLRRETEELKEELALRKREKDEQGAGQEPGKEESLDDGVLKLSRALDSLHASTRSGPDGHSAEATLAQKLASGIQSSSGQAPEASSSQAAQQAAPVSPGILSHAAAFDARLTLLEAALGIPNTPYSISPDDPSNADIQPILPTLNHLSSQLSTLTSTLTTPSTSTTTPTAPLASTTPHIEALSARIRKLTADAEALSAARTRAAEASRAALSARMAAAASNLDDNGDGVSLSSDPTEADSAANEQIAKIQALYATLPTINSLHPLLPSVLERLRSLRAIHAGAAQASEDLSALEQRQAEMKKEIDQWREGLKVVEEKMKEGEAAMKGNMEVIGPWIKELEARLQKLGA